MIKLKSKKGIFIGVLVGIVAVVVFWANQNIEITIGGNDNQNTSLGQTSQSVQGSQVSDQTADHHGSKPADSKIFDSLLGKAAPDFTLEDFDGKKMTLSSLRGQNVILFFNEGLMCYPACWNQIAAFAADKELTGKNTVILNITADPKDDWRQAIAKMPELAPATVLFDSDRQISSLYGVLALPSSMHKGQFPGHTYIIVDKEGIIRFTKDDPQMAVRNKELAQEMAKL
ncbi:MAG: peroxiredoxin family protein [bacterium]|nr:peroxiredoxin family protein [bacterium]